VGEGVGSGVGAGVGSGVGAGVGAGTVGVVRVGTQNPVAPPIHTSVICWQSESTSHAF